MSGAGEAVAGVIGAVAAGTIGLWAGYEAAARLPPSDASGHRPSWGGPVALGITLSAAVLGWYGGRSLERSATGE